jgi:hypothetical protein
MLSHLLGKEKITHLFPRAYQMSTFDYQSTQVCTGSKNKGGRLFQKVHSQEKAMAITTQCIGLGGGTFLKDLLGRD